MRGGACGTQRLERARGGGVGGSRKRGACTGYGKICRRKRLELRGGRVGGAHSRGGQSRRSGLDSLSDLSSLRRLGSRGKLGKRIVCGRRGSCGRPSKNLRARPLRPGQRRALAAERRCARSRTLPNMRVEKRLVLRVVQVRQLRALRLVGTPSIIYLVALAVALGDLRRDEIRQKRQHDARARHVRRDRLLAPEGHKQQKRDDDQRIHHEGHYHRHLMLGTTAHEHAEHEDDDGGDDDDGDADVEHESRRHGFPTSFKNRQAKHTHMCERVYHASFIMVNAHTT